MLFFVKTVNSMQPYLLYVKCYDCDAVLLPKKIVYY